MRPLALLVLLSFVVPLSPAASAADAGAVLTFEWEAPADTTGALAVRMTFDVGEANQCTFQRKVSGGNLNEAVHSYEQEGPWGGAFYSVPTAHAHVERDGFRFDSRTLRASNAAWSLTMTTQGPYSGVFDYTLVVMNASSWVGAATGYQAPMRIVMTCGAPFTVGDFWKGREAAGFTHHSLSGGSGANANQLFGSVSVNLGDRFDASFASGTVTLDISSNKWEGVTMGALGLSTPSGTTQHDLAQPIDLQRVDGPGAYGVTLDYVGVSLSERIIGVMYGLDPVASLDA